MNVATSYSASAPSWGDKEAWFCQVFRHDARYVWRALLGLGVPEKDVEDASQQVFVIMHRKLEVLDPAVAVRTFLYGICLRVASEFRRRARSENERLVAELPEQSITPTQEAVATHREALRQLQQILDGLETPKREVWVLYEIEGLEMPVIAGVVGCPLQTAYSRLHAARASITAAYEAKSRAPRGLL